MTTQPSIEQADNVARALEALRARWGQTSDAGADDQQVLQQASEIIAQLRDLVSTMDGQLAAMRVLAQKQFRPKSEHVPPGQLALSDADQAEHAGTRHRAADARADEGAAA
jgi:hypothetical protein